MPVEGTQIILYIYIAQKIFDNVIYSMTFRPTDRERVRMSYIYPHPRTSIDKPYKRSMDDEACDSFLQKLKANPVQTGVEWRMCPEPLVLTNEIKLFKSFCHQMNLEMPLTRKHSFCRCNH